MAFEWQALAYFCAIDIATPTTLLKIDLGSQSQSPTRTQLLLKSQLNSTGKFELDSTPP